MSNTFVMRLGVLFLCIAVTVGVGAEQTSSDAEQSDPNLDGFTDRIQENVVFSAKVGQIESNASIYRSYSNAEVSAELNGFHKLSPTKRRELLLEVQRRIRDEGGFVVDKEKQHFGRVVRETNPSNSDGGSPELQIEEIVVARLKNEESAAENELEAQRRENAAKQQRPPTVRVNSGRAYSQ